MGSGSSTSFKSIAESLPRASDAGRVVHVVGTVGAVDGVVLSSPFGGDVGAAIRIACSRQAALSSKGIAHGAFRAQSAVDFHVVSSGGIKIRVLMSDVEAWAWRLGTSHTAYNIMVDKSLEHISPP